MTRSYLPSIPPFMYVCMYAYTYDEIITFSFWMMWVWDCPLVQRTQSNDSPPHINNWCRAQVRVPGEGDDDDVWHAISDFSRQELPPLSLTISVSLSLSSPLSSLFSRIKYYMFDITSRSGIDLNRDAYLYHTNIILLYLLRINYS